MSLASTPELQAIVAAGREAAYKALAERRDVTFTVAPLALLALLDCLEGCDGYSRLLRDDAIDRLNEAVDRAERHALALGIMAVNK